MPLGRAISKGLVYTIDLSKIADRENPRTIEAPLFGTAANQWPETVYIDWGDGSAPEAVPFSVANNYHKHTYAEGAGDVFTVVIRSATGRLPIPLFTFHTDGWNTETPTNNLTLAVVSIDHFGGMAGTGNSTSIYSNHIARVCVNLEYIDTRLAGLHVWTNFESAFNRTILNQPAESFCFDFCSNATALSAVFRYTKIKGELPTGFFDSMTGLGTIANAFYGCSEITKPYVFWNEDGMINTDKFPTLTASNAGYCYAACSAALRAQVPSAYGGTMTVS